MCKDCAWRAFMYFACSTISKEIEGLFIVEAPDCYLTCTISYVKSIRCTCTVWIKELGFCPTSDICTDNSQARLSVPPKIPWQISDSSDCILACQISFSELTWISSKQFYPFHDFQSEQIQRSCGKIFTALITHAGIYRFKKNTSYGND